MFDFPVYEEIDPVCALTLLDKVKDQTPVFLDSAKTCAQLGRYSFLGFDPFQILTCKNGQVYLNDKQVMGSPFEVLAKALAQYSMKTAPHLPPFQGGVAGVFGYELSQYLEKLPELKQDDLVFPDLMLGFYDVVVAWDHIENRTFVLSSGFPELDHNKRLVRAKHRLSATLEMILTPHTLAPVATKTISASDLVSTFTAQNYQEAVIKVKNYIREGDIFETNISQRFCTQLPDEITPFDLYRRLRAVNQAPFAGYMAHQDYTIASASPERFLKLTAKQVQTRPIKGTSPRYSDKEQDNLSIQTLVNSEKDRAENIMIVDLMRNDLSRVCLPHTVKVPQLCALETFATVHHLVSVVEGTLRPECHALELLKATFPGGSVTGAPKIRAMEIIAEMEPTVRAPYCGSMGYIGFNGDMDLSIIIRTFNLHKQFCTFQVGGAITLDSVPEQEYEETLVKARAMLKTLIQTPSV
jgi:para-aminobenzoate synthetase component 1